MEFHKIIEEGKAIPVVLNELEKLMDHYEKIKVAYSTFPNN